MPDPVPAPSDALVVPKTVRAGGGTHDGVGVTKARSARRPVCHHGARLTPPTARRGRADSIGSRETPGVHQPAEGDQKT
jgi:hypothetical protein